MDGTRLEGRVRHLKEAMQEILLEAAATAQKLFQEYATSSLKARPGGFNLEETLRSLATGGPGNVDNVEFIPGVGLKMQFGTVNVAAELHEKGAFFDGKGKTEKRFLAMLQKTVEEFLASIDLPVKDGIVEIKPRPFFSHALGKLKTTGKKEITEQLRTRIIATWKTY